LLAASYSSLLSASYSSDLLRRALPYLAIANPKLLACGTYYVAECASGDLVGCGGWTMEQPGSGQIIEREAHLRHFAIDPGWVRRGIGASLLDRSCGDARSHGVRKLYCLSTLNAEPFYRAGGFEAIGPIGVEVGPNLTFPGILMTRELG
jgi:GNAT superfamily N-acetyltransferase